MNRLSCLLLLMGGFSAFGASSVGLLPEERVAIQLAPTEKSPFGLKILGDGGQPRSTDNEENWIRMAIQRLPVSGVVNSEDGRKVLLGSLILEKGKILPPVIPQQAEVLRVLDVSDQRAEIGFLEADGSIRRKIVVFLDVTPTVQFRLGVKVPPPPR